MTMTTEEIIDVLDWPSDGDAEWVTIRFQAEAEFRAPRLTETETSLWAFLAHSKDVADVFTNNILFPNEALLVCFGDTLTGALCHLWGAGPSGGNFMEELRKFVGRAFDDEQRLEFWGGFKELRCPEDLHPREFARLVVEWQQRSDWLGIEMLRISVEESKLMLIESLDMHWRVRYSLCRNIGDDSLDDIVHYLDQTEDLWRKKWWRTATTTM